METAIVTRTFTTNTLSEIDLVKEGWQIKFTTADGTIVATKQDVVETYPETAELNMTIQNTEKYNTHEGEIIVSKIDFGPGKVGLIWNAKDRCAEAWMNRPVITDISSVTPKEDEEYISQEDIDYDNACFDADMRDFEEAAAAWDARTSKEEQDWFRNRY